MALSSIQTDVWDLVYQEDGSPTSADNVSLLSAFNQIRLDAERKQDWVASETVGYVSVAATTGSLLSDAKVGFSAEAPSGSALAVKQIRWLRTREQTSNSSGYAWVPGKLMNKSTYEALLVRQDREGEPLWTRENTPVVFNESTLPETRNLILRDGLSLYSLRDAAVSVQLWCYKWLDSYGSFSAADDFLMTYGRDYLMWSAVLYMNKKKGNYVPRNEGSLTEDSIQERISNAWDSLLLWDTGLKNNNDFIIA